MGNYLSFLIVRLFLKYLQNLLVNPRFQKGILLLWLVLVIFWQLIFISLFTLESNLFVHLHCNIVKNDKMNNIIILNSNSILRSTSIFSSSLTAEPLFGVMRWGFMIPLVELLQQLPIFSWVNRWKYFFRNDSFSLLAKYYFRNVLISPSLEKIKWF